VHGLGIRYVVRACDRYTDAVAQIKEEARRRPDRFAYRDIHWGMDLQVCVYVCGVWYWGGRLRVYACGRVRACVRACSPAQPSHQPPATSHQPPATSHQPTK
jgi:hypothetical protein